MSRTPRDLARRVLPPSWRRAAVRRWGWLADGPAAAPAGPDCVRRTGARAARSSTMTLTELGREFGTDKAGMHRYTGHYERHLSHLRDRPMTLLEIGVGGGRRHGGGGSLRMWKWYFPKAQVVGLDIEDKSAIRADRIHVHQGDQSDAQVLRRLHAERGPFQVIIDDGSHRNDHVRATFEVLFPLLADDGVYVIEDTQTSYWPPYGGSADPHARDTMMAMVKDLLDGLNHEEFLDERRRPTYTDRHVTAVHCYHNLVFIEKGAAVEGTHRRRALRSYYADHPELLVDDD